jgi:hypothetical protein
MDRDLLIDFVIALIESEEPVPVDIHARLVADGIDVEFLIRKYTK